MSALPHVALANASVVTPRLLVGGDLSADRRTAAAQLGELVSFGVTHIVDVRIEWSDERLVAAYAPGIRYLHAGIDDIGETVPAAWFTATVGWILEVLLDPAAVVLAHCHMGINRGPSLGVAVLLAQGWDVIDAMSAIREARPIAAMAYAEDALAWHHDRRGASPVERLMHQVRVARWRQEHPLDVVRLIREQRSGELDCLSA